MGGACYRNQLLCVCRVARFDFQLSDVEGDLGFGDGAVVDFHRNGRAEYEQAGGGLQLEVAHRVTITLTRWLGIWRQVKS
jgi:hypothetical protein